VRACKNSYQNLCKTLIVTIMTSEPKEKEFRPMAYEIKGQKLDYPAKQSDMNPAPDSDLSNYSAANKLQGKVAIITGGDSGIGRAIAIAFGIEGADVAILYNVNDSDAEETKERQIDWDIN
jgi:hypothetical protein